MPDAVSDSRYRLHLLGVPHIEGPSGVLEGPMAHRHRLALLGLLAVAPQKTLPRDRLLGLLWPESPINRARDLLNAAVHSIRRALGDHVLLTHAGSVSLDFTRLSVDVIEFEEAVKAGNPSRAVDLYTGPFLDGLVLPDAVEFEHWYEVECDRLQRLFHLALEQQAESVARIEGAAQAVVWWRRRLASTPSDAHVVVRLMETLAAAGDRVGALEAAAIHTKLLQSEFSAPPDPEVQALVSRLHAGAIVKERRMQPAGISQTEERPAFLTPASKRAGWSIMAAVAAVLLIAGLYLSRDRLPAFDRDRVVIVPLDNHTGDKSLDHIGMIAAEIITEALQRSGMQVVPTLNALRAWRFIRDESQAEDLLKAIAVETNSAFVVSGTFLRDGDTLRYRVQLTDVVGGRPLVPSLQLSNAGDPSTATIQLLADRVAGGLATAVELQPRVGYASGVELPKYAAYIEVAKGYEQFLASNFQESLSHLRRASTIDSTYLTPLLMAGFTHYNLNQIAQADSLAKIVATSRDRLSKYQRLRLDHLQAAVRSDWATQLSVNTELFAIAPQSDAAFIAAFAAVRLNRPRQALIWLDQLQPDQGAMRGWIHYWGTRLDAHHRLGQHRAELKSASRARRQYPDRPEPINLEIRANAALGRLDQIRKGFALRRALPTRSPASDLAMYINAIVELGAHGFDLQAKQLTKEGLDEYRSSMPTVAPAIDVKANAARLYYLNRQWAEARDLYEALARERPNEIGYQGHLAAAAAMLGDRDEARRISRNLAELNQPYLFGANLLWCARIAAALHHEKEAVRFLELAIRQGQPIGYETHHAPEFESMRTNRDFRELLRPKG